MTIDTSAREDQTLAATHRAMWALGDYALMAEEVMAPLGPILVAAAGIGPGVRVLDVAAGSGNISLPAAKTGATVISTDLTPELLQRSQARGRPTGADPAIPGSQRASPAVCRRRVRHGDLSDRRDVRTGSSGRGRRAGPRLPAWRDDRCDQLDVRGILRPDAGNH